MSTNPLQQLYLAKACRRVDGLHHGVGGGRGGGCRVGGGLGWGVGGRRVLGTRLVVLGSRRGVVLGSRRVGVMYGRRGVVLNCRRDGVELLSSVLWRCA